MRKRKTKICLAATLTTALAVSTIAATVLGGGLLAEALAKISFTAATPVAPWAVNALVLLDDNVIDDDQWYALQGRRVTFDDEQSCKAFLDSDAKLKSANDGLKADVAKQLGATAVVVVSCRQVEEDAD